MVNHSSCRQMPVVCYSSNLWVKFCHKLSFKIVSYEESTCRIWWRFPDFANKILCRIGNVSAIDPQGKIKAISRGEAELLRIFNIFSIFQSIQSKRQCISMCDCKNVWYHFGIVVLPDSKVLQCFQKCLVPLGNSGPAWYPSFSMFSKMSGTTSE